MAAKPRTDDTKDDAIAAHARTYFSDQVEAAEVIDAQIVAVEDLIQQARMRIKTRDRLAASYDQREEVAAKMGMTRSAHFARLHNEGDLGIINSLTYELYLLTPDHMI